MEGPPGTATISRLPLASTSLYRFDLMLRDRLVTPTAGEFHGSLAG